MNDTDHHGHNHTHTHGHDRDRNQPSAIGLWVRTVESALTEKGYTGPAAVDALVEVYETQGRATQRRHGRRESLDRQQLRPVAAR
jgi:hypothetical protein